MTNYRIFMIGNAGRILTASDADCENDEAAFAWAAATLGSDARAEIWQAGRCVGTVSGTTMMPHAIAPQFGTMLQSAWQQGPAAATQDGDAEMPLDIHALSFVNDNAAPQSCNVSPG
jgi:hypothetical protein